MISSIKRKSFWISGIVLYLSAPIVNLFSRDACAVSIFSFIFYTLIFLWYSFTENESTYWNLSVLFVVAGFFIYPFTYKYTQIGGVYIELKQNEKEFTQLAKEFNEDDRIGFLSIKEVKAKYDYPIYTGRMKNLKIFSIRSVGCYVYFITDKRNNLLFINDDQKNMFPNIAEGKLEMYLGNNWYIWSDD